MASGILLRVVCPRVSATKLLLSSSLRNFAPATTTTVIPQRESSGDAAHHGDYSRLWTLERVVAASLLPVIPATIAMPTPVLDYTLALLFVVHNHWSLEGVIHDYVRVRLYGANSQRIATAFLYFLSTLTLGGLFYFNYNDVGLGNAVRMLWKL